MKTKLKYIIYSKYVIYGIVILVTIFVEILDIDYSSENPPEKKLCDNGIKVNSIISATSAIVR